MTEEKTKEVAAWAEDIARWFEIPQAWVWHLAEYHPEAYEILRNSTEWGNDGVDTEVLSDDGVINANVLLETIKQKEGCEEWARQAYLEEFGEPLSKCGFEEEIEYVKEVWETCLAYLRVYSEGEEYEDE